MLITDNLSYADLFSILEESKSQLGRSVNPTIYSPVEWVRKQKQANNFITQVLKHQKIFLIGSEDELNKFR